MAAGKSTAKIQDKRLYNQHLIEFVRSNQILYNSRHDDYKNTAKKQLIWAEYGAKLTPKQDEAQLKANWNSLRSNYARHKKQQTNKLQSGSGTSAKQGKQWEYYESMKFIDDTLAPCESAVSVPIRDEQDAANKDVSAELAIANDEENRTNSIRMSLVLEDSSTGQEFDAEEIFDDDMFTRPQSNCSYDYTNSPGVSGSTTDTSQSPIKRVVPETSSQKPEKRKKTGTQSSDDNFLSDLNTVLNSSCGQKDSSNNVNEMIGLVKDLLNRQSGSNFGDEDRYLSSLKSSLQMFSSNKKNFEIVKHRISEVIHNAIIEFLN